MTEPPAQEQVPAREGSKEQATRGIQPVLSPPWFVDPTRLDVVDSTNRYLAGRAAEGAPEGLSVVADRQTAGRGRLQRTWVDVPGGSLLCSMLFRPALKSERWFLLSMLVALAGLDACADAAGVDASCKWPNDLVVGGRKVGGILAEVVPPPGLPHSGTPAGLVVGLGLNCNWGDAWEAAPLAPSAMATSLDRVAGRPVDREAVASRLLERVAQRYAALTGRPFSAAGPDDARPSVTGGPPPPGDPAQRALLAEYRRKLDTVGRLVRVELADEDFSGRALDVDDAGRLLVDVGMCTRTVEAGDVVHVR